MHETAENMSNADFLTSDTVRAAFEGKLRFTTLVEARLHGMKDEDVDSKLDDVNHVSSVKRGSGSFNSVFYAKTLYYKGHVVSTESWNDHDRQREIAGSVPLNRNNGWHDDVVMVGSKTVGSSFKGKAYVGTRILHLTEGYFRRNIMSAIAKPGWFEE